MDLCSQGSRTFCEVSRAQDLAVRHQVLQEAVFLTSRVPYSGGPYVQGPSFIFFSVLY